MLKVCKTCFIVPQWPCLDRCSRDPNILSLLHFAFPAFCLHFGLWEFLSLFSLSCSPPCQPAPPVPRKVYIQAFYLLGLFHPSAESGLSTVRPRWSCQEAASLSEPGGPQTWPVQGPSGGAEHHGDQPGGHWWSTRSMIVLYRSWQSWKFIFISYTSSLGTRQICELMFYLLWQISSRLGPVPGMKPGQC